MSGAEIVTSHVQGGVANATAASRGFSPATMASKREQGAGTGSGSEAVTGAVELLGSEFSVTSVCALLAPLKSITVSSSSSSFTVMMTSSSPFTRPLGLELELAGEAVLCTGEAAVLR